MSMLLGLLLLTGTPEAQAETALSPWSAIQFMVGEWEGESDGQPGKGTVKRSYRFVLGGKFLHEQNVSTYPPQPKNEKGEVHEHWSFFSHDRARHTLVLRQFHQEGFVNQFAMAPVTAWGALVFESEALENVPAGIGRRGRPTRSCRRTSSSRPSSWPSGRQAPTRSTARRAFKRVTRP